MSPEELADLRADHAAPHRCIGGWQKEGGDCVVYAMADRLLRVEELFAGGPDTPCRTVYRGGMECVEVPMADLQAALT